MLINKCQQRGKTPGLHAGVLMQLFQWVLFSVTPNSGLKSKGKGDSKTYSLLECSLDVFVFHPLAGQMSLL